MTVTSGEIIEQRARSPDTLKERLARWQFQPPTSYDFFSGFEVFNLENYLYVLYGMDYQTNLDAIAYRYPEAQLAAQLVKENTAFAKQALQQLPSHRALIDKIKQYGLSHI